MEPKVSLLLINLSPRGVGLATNIPNRGCRNVNRRSRFGSDEPSFYDYQNFLIAVPSY